MQKIISIKCPKCNNNHHFYKFGKDKFGNPKSIVSDRYSAYKIPTKCYFPNATYIRVESFKDDISNNLIESFNNRFKA